MEKIKIAGENNLNMKSTIFFYSEQDYNISKECKDGSGEDEKGLILIEEENKKREIKIDSIMDIRKNLEHKEKPLADLLKMKTKRNKEIKIIIIQCSCGRQF